MNKKPPTPKQRARARFNKLVDKCNSLYFTCQECELPIQCEVLSSFNIKAINELLYDQLTEHDRKIVVRVLGVTNKELAKQSLDELMEVLRDE